MVGNLPRQHYDALADNVVEIGLSASIAILDIYNDPAILEVQSKADQSPVTKADIEANQLIVDGLKALTPDIPILTEESTMAPFDVRKYWHRYWLVDPLDGTKEFIRRNDQFTVNIALIENGRPRLGVVYVPVSHTAYVGVSGSGAYKVENHKRHKIRCRPVSSERGAINIVTSSHHGSAETEKFISSMSNEFAQVKCQSIGSSLKFCLLAEGVADIYPRLAPTSEWDTAAAQAVLMAAGGMVYQYDLVELKYNSKENILNPYFYAVADPSFGWLSLIEKSQLLSAS